MTSLLEAKHIDRFGCMKEHRYLIDCALKKGFLIAVECQGDTLQKPSSNFDEIIDACECVDECHLHFYSIIDGEEKKPNLKFDSWAFIVHERDEPHTVNDYMCGSDWMEAACRTFTIYAQVYGSETY